MIALIVLVFFAILVMFGSFVKIKNFTKVLALLGILTALGVVVFEYLNKGVLSAKFYGISALPMLYFGSYSLSFTAVLLVFTFFIVLLAEPSKYENNYPWTEFYALILFSLCGAICMVSQMHLLMLFLGIEILSIPLYVLATSDKQNVYANEAGLKYFLMGSFATGILLFGLALIYGTTGTLDFFHINQLMEMGQMAPMTILFKVGLVLLIIAMLFKLAAAPFHFWSPDVYQGSPNIVTLFMATVVKTASVGCFMWLMYGYFSAMFSFWEPLLAIVAAITLLLANITAAAQTSFKRMLGYSSISQVGYILIGFIAVGATRAESGNVLYYLMAYGIASIVLFAGLIVVSAESGDQSFEAFNGLFERNKFLSIAMLIAMLSLAGIPITAGFFGKFLVLSSAVSSHLWLVIIALVSSAISIYYYFKVIQAIFFKTKYDNHQEIRLSWSYTFAIGLATIALFALCFKVDFITALLNQF